MKKLFGALLCVGALLMTTACDPNQEPTKTTYAGDTWLTYIEQFDVNLVDNQTNNCYDLHVWCDGTTIIVEPFWGTEAQMLLWIENMMNAELQAHGVIHKKYRYYLVEEKTEAACEAREWPDAKCWIETITYPDKNGVQQTSTEYCWMPEKNMQERHDYYMAHLEQIGVFNHSYVPADIDDKDACLAMNPEEPVDPTDPEQPKDYDKFDNVTYKCWMVTQSAYGMEIISYVWMTERQVNEYYDSMKLPYTYEVAAADDQDACQELQNNLPEEEEACWRITVDIMGYVQTSYYWGTQSEAVAQVVAINESGAGSASYSKAAATDPDSCHE